MKAMKAKRTSLSEINAKGLILIIRYPNNDMPGRILTAMTNEQKRLIKNQSVKFI